MAERPLPPRLVAITDLATLGRDPASWAAALDRAGVDGLWLRDHELDDRARFDLARRLRGRFSGTLVIGGRADLALATGADGVHLPGAGLPPAALRRAFGDRLLLGQSCHRLEEVDEAARAGADWITYSPIYDTPSKRGVLAPVGLAGLRQAADRGLPVLALGGVSAERVAGLLAAGAWGVAGIRCFQTPDRVAALVEALHGASGRQDATEHRPKP